MAISKANIGQALHSVADDHVTAVANDIYDETLGKYQSEINAEVGQGDGVYDISAANPTNGNPTPYGDLQAALTAFTDATKKKGGMTIKFIQGTGNDAKYVQYRLIRTTFPSEFSEDDWEESNAAQDVDLSTITDEYTFYDASIIGKCIDANGSEKSAWNYCCTPYIEATQGDEFIFTASSQNADTYPVIFGYNSDKSFNKVLSRTVGTNKKLIVPEGISFIRFSALKDYTHEIKRVNKQSIPVILDNIEEVSSRVDDVSEKLVEEINDTLTEGYENNNNIYINNDGTVRSLDGWAFKEFIVKKGATLSIRTYPKNNIAVLSKKISSNSYQVLFSGATESGVTAKDYTYNVDEDMTVAVCFYKSTTNRYFKTTLDILDNLQKDVSATKTAIEGIGAAIDSKIDELGISSVIEDGLTEPTNLKYIRASDGSVLELSPWAYKTFSVKKGEYIELTTATHTSIAPISKQITAGSKYSTLVAPVSGQTKYTYTANADMVIAVCFKTTDAARHYKSTYHKIPAIEENIEKLNGQVGNLDTTIDNKISELGIQEVTEDNLTENLHTGYVRNDGVFLTNTQDYSAKYFTVKAGAHIEFKGYLADSVAPIARYFPTSNSFNVLVRHPGGDSPITVTYDVTEDMTVVFSFLNASNKQRSVKFTTNKMDVIEANIQAINKLKGTLFLQDINYGYLFDKIAVIGDSLASGRVEGIEGQSDAVGADFYSFSWLSFLAKRWNCESFKCYSRAQQHTLDWAAEWRSILSNANEPVFDAYFIALGTNNDTSAGNDSVDIDEYKSIVDAVRQKAPHAAIFLMSLYQVRAGNTVLQQIASEYMQTDKGIYYLDYANKATYLRYSAEVNWRGHFSTIGYVYAAFAINNIVNEIIWENRTEQFWQQFAKYHNKISYNDFHKVGSVHRDSVVKALSSDVAVLKTDVAELKGE